MKIIDGGVTAAKGFKAAAAAAEIKYKGRTDMAMVYSEVPCVAAGTFTTNVVKAAPVKWDQDIVYNHPSAQVVICNSGIANACTGAEGYGYCKETADAAAEILGVAADSVLVASTGVIGMQVPIDRIKNGVKMMAPKLDDDHRLTDNDRDHFLQVLFHAYQNGDISALLLELCGRSMFDLLREAYLIPKKFHGKAGENPVLLTDAAGELRPGEKVSAREYAKFKETYEHHECAPRSALYLADGYDLVRTYTEGLNITEEKDNRKRGVLALYALPDTCKLGLTEAQAYAVVWDAFQKIQKEAPRAMVYYGQETGLKKENPDKPYDEIGILLPIHEFEKKMLQHLDEIDGIVLACREKMMEKAGNDSLQL